LKEALHTKYTKETVNGLSTKHKQLQNLSENFEEDLVHNTNAASFRMGQPFE
jgi:hypothetical protein